jgi:DNA-binding response OmpR family regulator
LPAFPEKPLRILAIEDDLRMLDLLRRSFWEHGHTVMTASDGAEGLRLAREHTFEVIVLDIGLPSLDGYQIASRLRAEQSAAAILMLTARDMEDDVIRGLDLGADDYIRKPFSFPELLARISSVTRTTTGSPSQISHELCYEDLSLDRLQRRVFRAKATLHLSRSEFALMETLMEHAGATVPRSTMIAKVWGAHSTVTPGALDTLVGVLRDKLDSPDARTVIRTIRGIGYCLEQAALDRPERRGEPN